MSAAKERTRLSVSPWAALAAGILFYYSDAAQIRVLALPIVCHELGHLLALRLLGCRIRELRLELGGMCIGYRGSPERFGEIIAAASGPLAGLLYALPASRLGPEGRLSALVSLLLSLLNLIPAQPLDGGRIAAALLRPRAAACLSATCAALTSALGLWLFRRGWGAALALVGLLLMCRALTDQFSRSAILPD